MDDQDFAAQIAAKTGGRVAYGGHGSYIVITYPTTQDRAMAAAKIRKMFPNIKLYKTGGNMNAIDEQGVAEAGSKNTEKTDQNWVDPALKRKMDYAFGHYAGYKDRPEAFFKWVMRSLEHSEHQDQEHSEQLQDLDQAISSIKKRLDSVLAQKNSRVAESRENKKQIITHILKESRS